jgi:hypothetical protein
VILAELPGRKIFFWQLGNSLACQRISLIAGQQKMACRGIFAEIGWPDIGYIFFWPTGQVRVRRAVQAHLGLFLFASCSHSSGLWAADAHCASLRRRDGVIGMVIRPETGNRER